MSRSLSLSLSLSRCLFPGVDAQSAGHSLGRSIREALAALALAALTALALAAQPAHAESSAIRVQDLAQLERQLATYPYTPVVVELVKASLSELSHQGAGVQARTREKSQQLLRRLGQGALHEGLEVGGNGFVTLYVNRAGLKTLNELYPVYPFAPSPEWTHRTALTRDAASLQRLHRAAMTPGGTEALITLNIERLSHSFLPDGSVQVSPFDQGQARALILNLRQKLDHLPDSRAYAALSALAQRSSIEAAELPHQVRVVLGLRELLAISGSPAVRDLVLATEAEVPRAPAIVDEGVDKLLETEGRAQLVISLKRVLPPGNLSAESEQVHAEAVKQSMAAVLSAANLREPWHSLPSLEIMYAWVDRDALRSLRADPRVERISVPHIGGSPAASVANQIVNFPLVWNSVAGPGFLRGQGAAVVVMDTGMQTDLDWFARANSQGASTRVTRQRCFSTTGLGTSLNPSVTVHVTSVCPQPQNSSFDSAAANAGHFTLSTCPYANASDCSHGSQVASLAAGQKVVQHGGQWYPAIRSGATESDIWAYTITSRNNSSGGAHYAIQDLIAALDDVWQASQQWPTSAAKPVVNISMQLFCFQTLRDSAEGIAVQLAVNRLRAMRIPVVAAMGNAGNDNAPDFPSCLSGVIKVGAVPNSLAPTTAGPVVPAYTRRSHQSNVAIPAAHPNEYIFMAPGGGGTFGVVASAVAVPGVVASASASFPTPSAFQLTQGTSFAAPLVAGAYAIYRAAVDNASVHEMSVWLSAPGRTYSVAHVRDNGQPILWGGFPVILKGLRFASLE